MFQPFMCKYDDAEDRKTCLEVVEEDTLYVSQGQSAYTENNRTLIGSVAEAGKNDAASALDLSDSELLCRKQKKAHLLDGLLDSENGSAKVSASVPGTSRPVPPPLGGIQRTSTPVSPPDGAPAYHLDAEDAPILRPVPSFPHEVLLQPTAVIPAGTTGPVPVPAAGGSRGTPTPDEVLRVDLDFASPESVLRAVRSFPLPTDERPRPVAGPPSLDQEMLLRRMEQLQIPVSLPQQDIHRLARLELLKDISEHD